MTIEPTTQQAPTGQAFAPVISTASVASATRGRQQFNDSDKDNYFEQ
ncbi:hypothetical protein OG897_31965 [Streptomyces sp. NBC_00237]|nr:hypothetical protein [Streptomyces sp. NBC_00237]MCX5206021.1 hypothetical protein [Streptomyces sp. NBC_00237]